MNFDAVISTLEGVFRDIVNTVPVVLNGLVVLLVGYLFAWCVRFILRVGLRRFGFDKLMDELNIADGLRSIGVNVRLSWLVAQVVFLLLMLAFANAAAQLMRLEAVAGMLEQLLVYLPRGIAALVVFLLGSVVAKRIGDMITQGGRGGGLGYAVTLGRIVQYLLLLIVIVLALGTLGINTIIIVTVLTIVLAAIGLSLGLALGLGARQIIVNILAGYYIRERFPTGQRIVMNRVQGEVSNVGSINTVVRSRTGTFVVPNIMFLESLVYSAPSSPTASGESASDQPSASS